MPETCKHKWNSLCQNQRHPTLAGLVPPEGQCGLGECTVYEPPPPAPTRPPCHHFKNSACALGLVKGLPSFNTCGRCKHRAAKPPSLPPIIPERIYVLNLDRQPERWAETQRNIATSPLLRDVPLVRWRATPREEMVIPDWWWNPKKNTPYDESVYATGIDQRAMIDAAYRDGLATVLILEDDARLEPEFDRIYAAATGELPATWHGLWLTGTLEDNPKPFSPNLNQCMARLQTAAYLLSRRGMHRVFSHVSHEIKQICDQATRDLHRIYRDTPRYFEPTTIPVAHTGWRGNSAPHLI